MSTPCSELMLTIACTGLPKLDALSASDPMVVVSIKDLRSGNVFHEVGRTERVTDNPNPKFVTSIKVQYYFEEVQTIKFDVYDCDANEKAPLTQHDFIGSLESTIGRIVGCGAGKPHVITHTLHSNRGSILIGAEEVSQNNGQINGQFSATNLDKKDLFGKSDPYLTISRVNPDGSASLVFKSEIIKQNLNPTWKPFTISLVQWANGDLNRSIKIECFDWDSDGSSDFIGHCVTTTADILGGAHALQLVNPKKQGKKNYTNSGVIHVNSFTLKKVPSFVEYLKMGLELNFSVAVDFTGSNGDPRQPSSLHFMNPHAPNAYQLAIGAVGSVIQDYDIDKLFPAFGFGAKLRSGLVSHAFSLTGDESNPFCAGIPGILAMYQQCLSNVQLWGPTNFAPIIQSSARIASLDATKLKYFVLLIITDGEITDSDETIAAIVEASTLPMSIIIIGVGPADFSMMEMLDGDKGALKSRGKTAARDIVQFVPFRDFVGKDPAYLTRAVLAELPDQVVKHYMTIGVVPPTSQ